MRTKLPQVLDTSNAHQLMCSPAILPLGSGQKCSGAHGHKRSHAHLTHLLHNNSPFRAGARVPISSSARLLTCSNAQLLTCNSPFRVGVRIPIISRAHVLRCSPAHLLRRSLIIHPLGSGQDCSRAQMLESSNAHLLKRSNAHLLECSLAHLLKCQIT